MKRSKREGITLIALVITIIILLILAGVTIAALTGDGGILNKAKTAQNENEEKTATEIINLKITNAQLQSYQEEEKMPNLQYLADRLCEDNEIQYVYNESKKQANTEKEKITVSGTSIFTKLVNYPYEFEIDNSLRLASINGVKIADSNSQTEEIKKLNERVSTLETAVQLLQNSSKTILINRNFKEATDATVANTWSKLEEVSLSGHGKGKAIISYTASNVSTKLPWISIEIRNNGILIGSDQLNFSSNTEVEWLRSSTTNTIFYDQDTKISFYAISEKAFKPYYNYSILLIPDGE